MKKLSPKRKRHLDKKSRRKIKFETTGSKGRIRLKGR